MDPYRDNPRILIVDDDEDHRDLVREALSLYFEGRSGRNVVAVGSAAACLEQDLRSFDIVLLDWHLPDMGGLALLEQVLARADVPVVFLTTESNTAKAAEAIERGAADYIVRMGDYLFALPAVVRKNLSQHHVRREYRRLQAELEETCEQLRIKNFQLEESLERLKTAALTDHLTGLLNRRSFAEGITRTYSEAVRYHFDLSCCMCDLDHYKQLNDTLGHQIGDEVLVMAASTIQETLRSSDFAARYGGDEMVLLLPHTSIDYAVTVAERIRSELARRSRRHPVLHHEVTMSFGAASLHLDHPTSADALVSMADRALYRAKRKGKNRIETFSSAPSVRP